METSFGGFESYILTGHSHIALARSDTEVGRVWLSSPIPIVRFDIRKQRMTVSPSSRRC